MIKIYITRVSRKIKNLREEKNLTQEELAEQLGISRQSIISVEKGKCLPSLPLALRIAQMFQLNLEELFLDKKKGGEEKMNHRHLMPWSPFGNLDRFFDEDEMPSVLPNRIRLSFPMVNVKDKETEIMITADIPGIKEEDLSIEVGDNFVDISGERREEKEEKEEGYFRQEVSFGTFSRRIPLPTEVKPDEAQATIKNGQLYLSIPKKEAAKPKVTKIKVKKA